MNARLATALLLAPLAALWTTWPDAPLAWAGVAGLVATGALVLADRRRWALVALGVVGAATIFLPASLFEWRPWANALLLVGVLATLLAPARLAVRFPHPGVLATALALAGTLSFLGAWTPTAGTLGTPTTATAALAALGMVLVIALTTDGDGEDAEEREA